MQFRLTKAVKAILIACFVGFLVQQTADQFFGAGLLGWLGLVPSGFVVGHRFWQLVTYAFLHADVMHLFLNMLMLVFIGSEVEAAWGTLKFLRFYFFCLLSAGIAYLLLQVFVASPDGLYVPMVGASGAVYGLLMAYGILFGERVLLFMMLFPMKAKYFVWVLAGVEFMSTVFSQRSGVAGIAHLGGMAAGFAYLWGQAAWTVARRRRLETKSGHPPKKRRTGDHLKLVVNRDERKDEEDPKTWH